MSLADPNAMTDNTEPADSETDNTPSEFELFSVAFRKRADTLTLIKQLNQLVKAVQRHRGITMGLLAGNHDFRTDFAVLQRVLERRLAALEAFARSTGEQLDSRDKENLHLAWSTIKHNWEDDKLSDNFELHSHFVEQLMSMTHRLGRTLEKPLLAESDAVPQETYPRMFKQIEILRFVTKQLPEMIEFIAKVRGLATYAAGTGGIDDTNRGKLRYVLQCARDFSEKLRHQAERLQELLAGSHAAITESMRNLRNLELKLNFLLNKVEMEILNTGPIAADSNHLFDLSTDIIDIYWHVVNSGLDMIRNWHEEELDLWIKNG